jgi:hypothetical protein
LSRLPPKQARDYSIAAHLTTFPKADCSSACLAAQLDNDHKQCGTNDETKIKRMIEGKASAEDVNKAGETSSWIHLTK